MMPKAMSLVFVLAAFVETSADTQQQQRTASQPDMDPWNTLLSHFEQCLAEWRPFRALPRLRLPHLQMPSFPSLPSLPQLPSVRRPLSPHQNSDSSSDMDITTFVRSATNSGGGWSLKVHRDGVRVWRRSVAGSQYDEIRGNGLIRASTRDVIALLRCADEETIRRYNPMYNSGYDLQELDKNTKVSYGMVRAIFPFQPRDTVTRVAFRELPHLEPTAGTAIVQRAVEHPAMPPRKGYVRAKILRGIFLVQAVPRRPGVTNFTFTQQVNAGGIVPAWLMNQLIAKDAVVFVKRIGAAVK